MSTPREVNRARIFEIIHLYEPISRAEIARRVGFSSAAVSNIVAELLDQGFVTELGRRSSNRGQPSIELGVEAGAACTLGLHFDHASIAGVIADLKGNILFSHSECLPSLPTPEVVLRTLSRVGHKLITSTGRNHLLGIGLASVGPVDLLTGSVTRTQFTQDWHNVALRQPLAEEFGLAVCMDNNATAAAIGEFWYGLGRQYDNFLHISVSSGLGGGLFFNRRVYRGASLNAAEFGHLLVPGKPPVDGCPPFLENFVSGFALQRDLGEQIIDQFDVKLEQRDASLLDWLDTASDVFAQALVSVDHLLDLETIIVGGQMPASFLSALIERVQQRLSQFYMPGWSNAATLQLGQTGADSTLLGAATLPLYDAFATTPHTVRCAPSLFKSVAAGGGMH